MRTGTVSYKLEDLKKGVIIPIGFVGENDFTKVFFDAEEIYKKYPSASVSMKVQPPKGGIYPATVTRDGNTVIWQVKEADVANRGGGELQLTFIDGETKIKTYIAKTDVKRSLAGNGPAPDPVQDWIDDAEDVLENVEAAEIHQPMIGLDGYWYTWNQETGEYEKTNTKAQGADGHSPVLTSSKSGKTTTLYADGEQIAQIQDGEDGQGADVIDDTAGEGDTDKTWSADKLADEFGDVLTAIQGKMDEPETAGTAGQIMSLDSNLDPVWVDKNPVDNISGSTPSITGVADTRYICGEVSTLNIVAPASGCIDVIFESGTTATVLTVTSAKSGVNAIKWANSFDPTNLEANTFYELNIMDGEYGVVASWT